MRINAGPVLETRRPLMDGSVGKDLGEDDELDDQDDASSVGRGSAPMPSSGCCCGCSKWQAIIIVGVLILVVSAVAIPLALAVHSSHPPPGPSNNDVCAVMCQGPILAAVNELQVVNDSKTFVDLPLRGDPATILGAFTSQFPKDAVSNRQSLVTFVNSHFGEAGSDLVSCESPDPVPAPGFEPSVVRKQTNATLRAWAAAVHGIWHDLLRCVAPSVLAHPNRHTLLPLPRPMVVPGGRFREVYFWDSLWIIAGLLRSELNATATAVVENLSWQARQFGHVPNGARAYYLGRSQPPILAQAALLVFQATGNASLVAYALPAIDAELTYFASTKSVSAGPGGPGGHAINVGNWTVHRYAVHPNAPRPESWMADEAAVKAAGIDPSSAQARHVFNEIAAAAETGWDFSSRWLRDPATTASARTSGIIPTDLNALLVQEYRAAAALHRTLGVGRSDEYDKSADALCAAINGVLWDERSGWWSDYILSEGRHAPTAAVTPAAFFPLIASCPGTSNSTRTKLAVTGLLHRSGLMQSGGVLTSLNNTSQQWDSPNSWAPLNHVLVHGLRQGGALTEARDLARRWLRSNLLGWQRTGLMFEKYDALVPGSTGGGGEYVPQAGFGWTNGVALDLLADYDWQDLEHSL